MKISVLTIFPQSFDSFRESAVLSRAVKRSDLDFQCVDIRDFAEGSYRAVDDSPYGGGPGMVMRVDTVSRAIESVRDKDAHVVLLSPRGKVYDQKTAHRLSEENHLVLVCGHYEGLDERVRGYVDEEISIGDYILTGGELAAQIICDSVLRLLPNSLREGSAEDESFETGLLEYPHYTHPVEFEGKRVPDVLLSGNDAKIRSWRQIQAIIETIKSRPDLFDKMKAETIGLSGAKVIIFDSSVLKIEKVSSQSRREVQALIWLEGKLPVPKVIYHEEKNDMSYLLMSRLKGKMLCDPKILHNRNRLSKSAAAALKMLWNVDISDCPFRDEGKDIKDAVLSHGDFCLPNILADNSTITGYLDWGYCTVAPRQADIDTCIESLENNLTVCFSDGTEETPLDRSAFEELLK
ncbi:MAG: tRNA (guanosine(37)-N1)-methyltransferase TrmD [Spirochaetales bacterium]|nr:tRNA (guanosine(37)-N1)-methyltransferase TrmD [Spirochaetales bacterium]